MDKDHWKLFREFKEDMSLWPGEASDKESRETVFQEFVVKFLLELDCTFDRMEAIFSRIADAQEQRHRIDIERAKLGLAATGEWGDIFNKDELAEMAREALKKE